MKTSLTKGGKPMKTSLTKGGKPMKTSLTKGGKPMKTSLTKGGAGSSKDRKKPKVKKGILKKSQLAKLGHMTLAQKCKKAAESAETAEEAASNLKNMLSKQEHSRVWSKHNVSMKGKSAKDKKQFDQLSKGEKGQQAALFMIKSMVPKFMQVQESMQQAHTLNKKEEWLSETQMVEKFGETEFWQHVQSGRIVAREDPWTWNVWNYCDKGNVSKVLQFQRKKKATKAQEFEPTAEDEEQWDEGWHRDGTSYLGEIEMWGKGKGKGKALTKGQGARALTKGTGKGKGKGQGQLALEDGQVEEEEEDDKTEEEQWKEVLQKAKRARDQATTAKADCEAALLQADKVKRVTKAGKKDVEELLLKMKNKIEVVKQVLAKQDKAMKLDKAKGLLVAMGGMLKEVKEETRELNALANKAGSKASKS